MKDICKEYFERMYLCEGQKWDLEHEVRKRDWEVLPKIKQNKNIPKIQIFYKTTLILFDEMKTKHKQTFCHPFFFNFDNFILIPKNRVSENHEKVLSLSEKCKHLISKNRELIFIFFTQLCSHCGLLKLLLETRISNEKLFYEENSTKAFDKLQ